MLLFHGGPAISDYLELLTGELDGWRSVSYQQRGLPPSALNGPFTVERHVADAVAVLDALGIGRAVVLGHSWGGHLALHFALAHPERMAGLVLVDPLGAVGDGGMGEMGQQLGQRLAPESMPLYGEISERLAGPNPTDADMLASLTMLWPGYFADPRSAPPIPSFIRASVAGYLETFASVAGHLAGGFSERLGEITAPVSYVVGASSPMPVSQGEQTAALLPNGELDVVPGAGHLPWHEQPGCVARALARLAPTPDLG